MSEAAPSGSASEFAASEMPPSVGQASPGGFPPYPPYATEPAPPSVADTIMAGRDLRVQHKQTPKRYVRPPPKPARPRGPKATDVKLSARASRAHARCLRRHGAVLTDRLERMAKPLRRNIIYLWREHAEILPPDTISRLRGMLDADEPFKPDQAYEYFVNLRKTKKKTAITRGVNQVKKDMLAMCEDKRFVWARNATVAFARGIQQRLSRPGAYALADGMLRLSNIILDDICSHMHTRTPSRRSQHPKAKFLMEMSDKVAVWIDEILAESEDRMLMMDFDEDEDFLAAGEAGNIGFTDDFLNMMGDVMDLEIQRNSRISRLKQATDFEATEFNTTLAKKLKEDLAAVAKPNTPEKIEPFMKEDKGPAFRLLVKAMHGKGNEQLYDKGKAKRTYSEGATELEKSRGLESDHDDPNLSQEIHSNLLNLSVIHNITFRLKSAPGLSGVKPDPKTAPLFAAELHKAVATVTPKGLANDMQEVVERCANYLSAFVRDRDKAVQSLIKMMKENPSKELAKRDNYSMNYGKGAEEIEAAPVLIPFTPIKDIADEAKVKLHKDMEANTPPDMKLPMQAVIQDASKYLSQPTALRSGVAGERYPLNFLSAAMKSLGSRPLSKYKSYGQTYDDGGETLKYVGPLEYDPKADDLKYQIASELQRGVPTRVAPTITSNISNTMDDASKHLAKVAYEKGEALEHLVNLMKEEGEAPLGKIQGYQQTYKDGARRIENAPTLANDKVDKGVYESVRRKLTNLTEKKPEPELAKQMPEIVDESSKFLAAPFPENEQEKRQVLADLMARKENEILGKDGLYKITYTEGGEEILKAPTGDIKAKDETKKQQLLQKVRSVIPDKKLQDVLKEPANEGSAHLSNLIPGRAAAMKVLHDGMKEDKDADFLTVGKFSKTNGQTADMLASAEHFGGQNPSPILVDKAEDSMRKISTEKASGIAKDYLPGGLDAKGLADWKKSGKSSQKVQATGESDEERRRREEEDAVARRRRAMKGDKNARISGGRRGDGEFDPEREAALGVLHRQLKSRGGEVFYKQPHAELTHTQASDWLSMKPPMKVDKSVKESGDTARLHKKFERKLNVLVSKHTPDEMYDAMQDVVIECSRILSEYFVSKSYKALVQIALISEMQKRGNEILVEVEGAAETFFFAAQRLKKAKSLEVKEPCSQVSYTLTKKLEDMIRCRSMARKLTSAMKDHIKDASDYLSACVTKPDQEIEAYVSLLNEMETAGESLLIKGNIPKTYKDAACYLRQLTSYEDHIGLPNSSLQSTTEGKLKTLMSNDTTNKSVMNSVISDSARLLVSYIMLQVIKTEALKVLIENMDKAGSNVLLRHGTLRKTYSDGADLLRPKTADEINVLSADPVVARKIQIKLRNIMYSCTPDKYKEYMDDVIEDATMYLAVHFLQPKLIKVCKCMKNVFVQCELWCDEILRRVARPCCTCSRHVSAQALAELVGLTGGAQPLRISPGSSRAFAPGIEMSITQCPSKRSALQKAQRGPCPAPDKTDECNITTSYLLYSTEPTGRHHFNKYVSKLESPTADYFGTNVPPTTPAPSVAKILTQEIQTINTCEDANKMEQETSTPSYYTPMSNNLESVSTKSETQFWQTPTTMFAKVHPNIDLSHIPSTKPVRESRRLSVSKRGYSSRAPIVTTDEMSDWHAMMVSLMWNVQAWREWIQENIDRAINYESQPNLTPEWLPSWGEPGPVWVVSACGAVPSGAVAAGVYDGEVIWLARSTHRCNVLPAALHPSKHSCVIYADGAVHYYTKYQVMCNANVSWVAWRAETVVEEASTAGSVAARAVKVAPGVLIGRVHYRGSHLVGAVHAPANRCHVVIFGRPFAFNCYELLVEAQDD
ncbi:C3 and PZP alpha-2-macroglobulin domain-containing protein 8 [Danaus plexippus plexippus]|uniref:C3 and PZP alpha-2-macroglobulin domain-containing protein 8 n=1 Tax=Danaus plexippus plexippus TaxID=278856 RepID=A0A212EGR5_DANPL|nr:C3 and PZP alpha-2-macroglobulin domain-containing protein 8 [Danaus plexippus plexippus]